MTAPGDKFIFGVSKLDGGVCKRLTNYIASTSATYINVTRLGIQRTTIVDYICHKSLSVYLESA